MDDLVPVLISVAAVFIAVYSLKVSRTALAAARTEPAVPPSLPQLEFTESPLPEQDSATSIVDQWAAEERAAGRPVSAEDVLTQRILWANQ